MSYKLASSAWAVTLTINSPNKGAELASSAWAVILTQQGEGGELYSWFASLIQVDAAPETGPTAAIGGGGGGDDWDGERWQKEEKKAAGRKKARTGDFTGDHHSQFWKGKLLLKILEHPSQVALKISTAIMSKPLQEEAAAMGLSVLAYLREVHGFDPFAPDAASAHSAGDGDANAGDGDGDADGNAGDGDGNGAWSSGEGPLHWQPGAVVNRKGYACNIHNPNWLRLRSKGSVQT